MQAEWTCLYWQRTIPVAKYPFGEISCGVFSTSHKTVFCLMWNPPTLAEICLFPVIFRIAIGNSEALIEKRQIEKGKVLPLQRAGGGTPQEQNAAIQEEKEHEAGKKQCTRRNIRSLE